MNQPKPLPQENDENTPIDTSVPTSEPTVGCRLAAGIDGMLGWMRNLSMNPYVRCQKTQQISFFRDAEATEPEDSYEFRHDLGFSFGRLCAVLAVGMALTTAMVTLSHRHRCG